MNSSVSFVAVLFVLAGLACVPPDVEESPASVDAGSPPAATPTAPELGSGDHSAQSVSFTIIATAESGLRRPRDLAFNPRRRDELWIVNHEDDSVLLVFAASSPDRRTERRQDAYALHFMDSPSSIAFGSDSTTIGVAGTFATCQESRNTYNQHHGTGNDFMGPALWSSDLDVFARHDPYGLGSHLDMLHGSPNCMGIAHERDNVYWAFGGKKQTGSSATERQSPAPAIVKYDFRKDHGIGADDHADGTIHQYVTGEVKGVAGIPSHMVFDATTQLLYIADTGNSRVVFLDTKSGTVGGDLESMEPLAAYKRVDGATIREVISSSTNFVRSPSGLELRNGLLYVSDNATGVISAFTRQGERVNHLDTGLGEGALAGMAFGPDGRLYFVDMINNLVLRVDPK